MTAEPAPPPRPRREAQVALMGGSLKDRVELIEMRILRETLHFDAPKGMTGLVFNTRRPFFGDVRGSLQKSAVSVDEIFQINVVVIVLAIRIQSIVNIRVPTSTLSFSACCFADHRDSLPVAGKVVQPVCTRIFGLPGSVFTRKRGADRVFHR